MPALPERVALFCIAVRGPRGVFRLVLVDGRRTLPMKTWRLRLVRANGGAVPPKVALLRYLAAWIGPALAVAAYAVLARYGSARTRCGSSRFNFLWAFVDPERQFLHDGFAGHAHRAALGVVLDDRCAGAAQASRRP